MPSETAAHRLIVETLGSRALNQYPEAPRHDQLLRRALRRRRVALRPVGDSHLVFALGGVVVGGMDSAVTTLVSAHARRITADRALLRRHLEIQEVPLPAQESTQESPEEQESAAPSIIRVFVVGERACASMLRLPATVLGDGRSTLRQLRQADVEARRRHALLAGTPCAADQLPDEQVPTAGETVALHDSVEISAGGLTVDVTATLPDALHELAVEAMMAVPGLFAAAVDLQVPDLVSAEGAVVLGVLPDADISLAHLPGYGEPRDVAGAIAEEILLRASR